MIDWTYAGFVANPTPPALVARAEAPVVPPVVTARPDPEPPAPAPAAIAAQAAAGASAQAPPASTPKPAPTSRPTTLADSSGQRWTHPDGAWLEQWVAHRNADLAAARARQRPAMQWTAPPAWGASPPAWCPPGGS